MKIIKKANQPSIEVKHPVLMFDGVCNLCNGFVQFVIKNDKKSIFRFASLQSDFAAKSLNLKQQVDGDYNTVYLLNEKNQLLSKSDVSIEICKRLGGIWTLALLFKLVPKSIRDHAYDFIAKNRYRFFGKKDQCMIPSPELKGLFYK